MKDDAGSDPRPASPAARPVPGTDLPTGLALAATLALGVTLRWWMAGHSPAFGRFGPLRSAHSHLAFYGVLLPCVWAAWRRAGWTAPGPRLLRLNLLATVPAAVDFAVEGYAPVSIVGSTGVLACWVAAAWPFRRDLIRPVWTAPVFACVLASAAAIPAVAVLSAREHPAATDWVHAFLSWILLGLAAPAALSAAGAKAPEGRLHTACVLAAGFAFGPGHDSKALFLAVPEGLLLLAAARGIPTGSLRWAWFLVGASLVGVGIGFPSWTNSLAVAGIHFLALGPVLATLAWPATRPSTRDAYLLLVAAFAGTIHLAGTLAVTWGQTASAVAGTLVAAAWLAAFAVRGRIPPSPRSPGPSPRS